MTAKYDGYTIEAEVITSNLYDGPSSNDLADVDTSATTAKYCELFEQKLREQFPGATIEIVTADDSGRGAHYTATRPNGTDDSDAEEWVAEFSSRVFNDGAFWVYSNTTH